MSAPGTATTGTTTTAAAAVTLDTEKHSNNGSSGAGIAGIASNNLSSRRRYSFLESDDDDDGEFGGASDNEAADSHFLETLDREYRQEESKGGGGGRGRGGARGGRTGIGNSNTTLMRLTVSQLQAHLPMGLDNEKHDDIGGLLLDWRSISAAKTPESERGGGGSPTDVQPEGSDDNNDNNDNNDSDDEFGDADDQDIPATDRLRTSFNYDEEFVAKSRVTPSQLQARIPSGLDNEKHEEINDLLNTRHHPHPHHSRSESNQYTNSTVISKGSTRDDNDDDEFGDANENDVPSNIYLQDAKDSMDMETVVTRIKITRSQLQSRLPAGLDGEKHEEITDLVNSRHYQSSEDLNDDEQDEFGGVDAGDEPVRSFLQVSTHSTPCFDHDEDDLMDGSDHQSETEKNHVKGIDRGKHEQLGELVYGRSSHCDDEGQEFGKANDSDRPVEQCIDRWKDSFNDDNEFDSDIEIIPLKGTGPLVKHQYSQKENLDDEKHDDLGDLVMDSTHWQRQRGSDDDDEFQLAGEHDLAVAKYLRAQSSAHSRGSVGSISLDDAVAKQPGLDDETHYDLGALREMTESGTSYGDGEFKSAFSLELANSSFLHRQISIQDDEFLCAEEDIEVDDDIASQQGSSS